MNEQERAAFYQEHRDDADVWGKAEPRDQPRLRRTLSATITVRFSPEEAEAIRRMAAERDLSYSDIVRAAVKAYADPRPTLLHRETRVNYGMGPAVSASKVPLDHDQGFQYGIPPATQSLAAIG